MKKFIGPRGCGKTTWAIEEALKNDAILVCYNKGYIKDKCKEFGYAEPRMMTYSDYLGQAYVSNTDKVVIDDLVFLLKQMRGDIIAYSTTEGA